MNELLQEHVRSLWARDDLAAVTAAVAAAACAPAAASAASSGSLQEEPAPEPSAVATCAPALASAASSSGSRQEEPAPEPSAACQQTLLDTVDTIAPSDTFFDSRCDTFIDTLSQDPYHFFPQMIDTQTQNNDADTQEFPPDTQAVYDVDDDSATELDDEDRYEIPSPLNVYVKQ